jgi:hypothetical protein
MVLHYMIPCPFNQKFSAGIAECGFGAITGEIADINIVKACLLSDIIGLLEGLGIGLREIGHFVLRIETADRPGDFRAAFFD